MKHESDEERLSENPAAAPRSRQGTAEVLAVLTARLVRLTMNERVVDAQIAVPGYDDPREGDRVLALTDDDGATWVIGVVRAPRPASLIDEVLAEPRPVEVRDKRGRTIFEYDPETDRAVLHVAHGDLELSVPDGALKMRARDGVSIETGGEVAVGARRIQLEASRPEGPRARVAMEPGELTLVASVLTAAGDRAELLAAKVGVKAHQLESHIERARTVVQVLEIRAGRIVQRARDVYTEVSGLSQTRAGRLKLVAEKAAQLVGENTLLKARDRMKVKGERIHLA